PGISSVTPIPKGLLVKVRIWRIAARVCAGVNGPLARIPRPPALDTAATSSGVEIQLMPGSRMGCSIPKSSVIRVFIAVPATGKAGILTADQPRRKSARWQGGSVLLLDKIQELLLTLLGGHAAQLVNVLLALQLLTVQVWLLALQ